MTKERRAVGAYGERLAERHLTAQGLVVLARNWRCARRRDRPDPARRRRRRVLRGQDQAERHSSARPPRRSARPRCGGCAGWPRRWLAESPVRPREIRFDVVEVLPQPPGAAAGRAHSARRSEMSYARVLCVGLVGVTGHLVEVEADLSPGLPAVVLTGLPDTALNEARDRVRAAVVNSGQTWPNRRITVNLLPATLPKHGSGFDLAIACALLAGAGELPLAPLDGVVVLGELGLDGAVRPIRGVLPMVAAAARAGITRVIVPLDNAARGRGRARRHGAGRRLAAPAGRLRPRRAAAARPAADAAAPAPAAAPTWPTSPGRTSAGAALEVAAAGGHHIALFGPPGAGKTMLAERLPSILPELDDEAALEVTALHSIAGVLPPGRPAGPPAAVPGAAPQRQRGRAGRRRLRPGPAGRAVAGPPRRAVPGRGAGVRHRRRCRRCASRWRAAGSSWPAPAAPPSTRPGSRSCWPPTRAPARTPAGDQHCACTAAGPPPLPRPALRPAARPDRHPDRAARRCARPQLMTAGSAGRVLRRRSAERVAKARAAAAARWSADGWRVNAEVPGPQLRRPPWRLPPDDTAALRVEPGPRLAVRPRLRPGPPAGLDDRRPRRPRPARQLGRATRPPNYEWEKPMNAALASRPDRRIRHAPRVGRCTWLAEPGNRAVLVRLVAGGTARRPPWTGCCAATSRTAGLRAAVIARSARRRSAPAGRGRAATRATGSARGWSCRTTPSGRRRWTPWPPWSSHGAAAGSTRTPGRRCASGCAARGR